MAIKREFGSKQLAAFTRSMKSLWQGFFLPGVVAYGIALAYLFYERPAAEGMDTAYIRGLDQLSFFIAAALVLLIFGLKRRYFSPRFSRTIVNEALKSSSTSPDREALLGYVFAQLRRKMRLVWLLALFITLDGVLYYLLTFQDRNMHVYFAVGAFSMLINYPRGELFADIPWFINDALKEYRQGNEA